MSVDPGQQRLFAAAPTNGTIEIVDLKTGEALRSLEGERPGGGAVRLRIQPTLRDSRPKRARLRGQDA